MRYKLGLDLGVSSIGSAIIEVNENDEPINVIDAGVRIFPVSEGAKERREQRTARKNNYRRKNRLKQLGIALYEIKLWDYKKTDEISSGTPKIRSANVYNLRNIALNEKIKNPHHIGRIFMHLAKHRGAGYISAQQENEESGNKNDPYSILPQRLKDNKLRTVGEYFYQRIENKLDTHKQIRSRKKNGGFENESTVDYKIPRYLVKDEFNKIWDKQAEYYPELNNNELKQKIYEIIFTEKPALTICHW